MANAIWSKATFDINSYRIVDYALEIVVHDEAVVVSCRLQLMLNYRLETLAKPLEGTTANPVDKMGGLGDNPIPEVAVATFLIRAVRTPKTGIRRRTLKM